MRRGQRAWYGVAGIVAAGIIGVGAASAQAPATSPGGDTAAGQTATDKVTPAGQQVAAASSFLQRMETMRDSVRRDLEEARQQRDVVKTLCLDDKLNQLDVVLRSASTRQGALEAASKRGETEDMKHEFTILSVLFQRAQQIDAEAKQCIGKEMGVVGESSTSVDIDPNLPNTDSSEYPGAGEIVQPPNCASCFR